jgi:putative photosynthetic complex assembly protein 2
MTLYGLPILYALFVWWFSTGLIIYLDGLPRHTFRWSMLGATALFAASIYGLAITGRDITIYGAYAAFTCGMLAWGWQEISFYMGFVTGPRTESCAEGCRGWRHFGHAIETSLYHELAIIASAALVVAASWGAPNQVGTWTFMVLWWMHQSAKLNVFLGVLNLNEEFLPAHLGFLKSFLTKKPMNLLFPVSVTISTVVAALLVQQATAADADVFQATGFTFLAILMTLAILEHWFLVLPLPAAALWGWGLKSRVALQTFDVEIVAGFLGAGKTTVLRRTLAAADKGVRTVVLVNDFGALGIDGSLLSGRGADVVELANGCICCSLRKDLASQLKEVIGRWAPQRILIEPSGVADIASLLSVLGRPDLRPFVGAMRVCAVIDAASMLRDYARMCEYLEAQARLAQLLIVNKADLVTPVQLRTVRHTLRALNPGATIVEATFGVVNPAALEEASAALAPAPAAAREEAAGRSHGRDHAHAHDAAPDFESWSTSLTGQCDLQGIHELLEAVARGAYGQVERVKGIVRADAGWIHFDMAGGRPSMAAFAPRAGEEARVVAIGRMFDGARLQAAFEACAVS